MKVSDLFKLAALGLLAGLAACSSEVLQGGPPEREPDLADGEMAVRMNIGGLGGSVTTRAGSSVVLAGEMDIKKLEVYCFVDLTAETSSSTAWQPNDYSLERVYTYNTLSSGNNMFLIPLGAGYQAVFGVPKDERRRIFALVANDIPRTGIKGLRLAEAGEGGNRSTATTFRALQQLKIRETALETSDVIATPLPMRGIAGRMQNNDFLIIYGKNDIDNGIEVTLRRAVARIDIRNLVSTKFTINKIAIKGTKNSLLFAEAGGLPMAGDADYGLVGFDEKTVTDAGELLSGAFYAYPVQGTVGSVPEVTITGSFGSSGSVSVKATFDGVATNPNALNPNTRYLINLLNSANNLIATLSIADWEQGESMDTEDVASSLNAGATIKLDAGQNVQNSKFDNNTFYFHIPYYDYSHSDDNRIATIEGADGNGKPIGIILPTATNLYVNDLGTTGTNGARKYSLHVISDRGGAPPKDIEPLSILTYDPTTKEQVTSEYRVYKDQVDVTGLSESFDDLMVFGTSFDQQSSGYHESYTVSPFGAGCSIIYEMSSTAGIASKLDVIIPENCSWLGKNSHASMGGYLFTGVAIASNLGGTERRATIEVRRYDRDSPTLFEAKKITIIQPQGRTIASSFLSDGYKIEIDAEKVAAGEMKFENNKITIAQFALNEFPFSIISNQFPGVGQSSYDYKFLLFETNETWFDTEGNEFILGGRSFSPMQYRVRVFMKELPPLNQPAKFTITYCDADGNRMTDTYELEVVAGATVN